MSKSNFDIVRRIGQIAHAESKSFSELISLSGLNPTQDFRGADLSNVDFGFMDVAGFDFSHANLSHANMSNVGNFDLARYEGANMRGAVLPLNVKILPPTRVEEVGYQAIDELFRHVIVPMSLTQLLRLEIYKIGSKKKFGEYHLGEHIYAVPSVLLINLPINANDGFASWRNYERFTSMAAYWDTSVSSRPVRVPCVLYDEDKIEVGMKTTGNPSGRIYRGDMSVVALRPGLEESDKLADLQRHSHQTSEEMTLLCRRLEQYTTERVEQLRKNSRYPIQVIVSREPDEGRDDER